MERPEAQREAVVAVAVAHMRSCLGGDCSGVPRRAHVADVLQTCCGRVAGVLPVCCYLASRQEFVRHDEAALAAACVLRVVCAGAAKS